MSLKDHTNIAHIEDASHPKKRKILNDEKSSRSKRRRSGKAEKREESLDSIMKMPMDIFVEIASYISPIDLLALARSSKRLRQILLSKGSKTIWRTSLQQVTGLPPCPFDLDEPQYASLMFDEHCWYCGKKSKRVDYLIRMRSCAPCDTDGALLRPKDFNKHFPTVPTTVLTCLPQNAQGYNMSTVSRFVEKYKEMGQGGDRYRWMCEQQDNYRKKVQESYKQILEYIEGLSVAKAQDVKKITSKRISDIESKLEELGHVRDDLPYTNDEFWAMLDQPRELTARIWNSIRPKLENLIASEKKYNVLADEKMARRKEVSDLYNQHQHQLKENLQKNLNDVHADSTLPSCRKFLSFESIRRITHVPEDPSATLNSTADMWSWRTAEIQEELDNHGRTLKNKLYRELCETQQYAKEYKHLSSEGALEYEEDHERRFADVKDANYPPLLYPTSLFRSSCCSASFHYPAIFSHQCSGKTEVKPVSRVEDYVMMLKLMIVMNVKELDVHSKEFRAKADLKQLLCGCCEPNVRRPMSFWDLLRHYDQEENLATKALHAKNRSADYLNTHYRLIFMNRKEAMPAIWISETDAEERTKEYNAWVIQEGLEHDNKMENGRHYRRFVWCRLCPRNQGFPMSNSSERSLVQSHIRTHHGKEPELSDMMWTQWVRM